MSVDLLPLPNHGTACGGDQVETAVLSAEDRAGPFSPKALMEALVEAKKADAAENAQSIVALDQEFETTEQLAARTHTSKKFWERKRLDGSGPPFIRVGARKVIYGRRTTDEWIATRTFAHRAAEAVGILAT